ncbi:MAG TPA: hypothetical protein PLG20_03140 [Candidatus Syntrophosphaera sp.]|nr:hypothetical protein [Candidatus Syntrophosphaera sp.]
MKNVWFYGTRILLTALFIGILAMVGGGGSATSVAILALFLAVVFGVIFLLNRASAQNKRAQKSGTIFGPIMQVLGLIIFISVLSALGFLHGVPGFIAWFVAIGLIFVLIFLSIRNRQRHFELTPSNTSGKNILAIVLGILAIVLPILMIAFGKFLTSATGASSNAWILAIVFTVLFVGLTGLGLLLINKWGAKGANRTLGYLAIIVAAILPGLVVLTVTKETRAFTDMYMAALIGSVLTYFALELKYRMT